MLIRRIAAVVIAAGMLVMSGVGTTHAEEYADGQTVVIAEQLSWGTVESVRDALVRILNNVERP